MGLRTAWRDWREHRLRQKQYTKALEDKVKELDARVKEIATAYEATLRSNLSAASTPLSDHSRSSLLESLRSLGRLRINEHEPPSDLLQHFNALLTGTKPLNVQSKGKENEMGDKVKVFDESKVLLTVKDHRGIVPKRTSTPKHPLRPRALNVV